ncbi:hypothetical protein KA005_64350 [bacterium]|nr:hypothetical protein [bacterium]
MTLIKGSTLADEKPSIDLRGPEGNVFYLIGVAGRYVRKLKLDADAIQKEMTTGDYDHALEVFEDNFGMYVDLITEG